MHVIWISMQNVLYVRMYKNLVILCYIVSFFNNGIYSFFRVMSSKTQISAATTQIPHLSLFLVL